MYIYYMVRYRTDLSLCIAKYYVEISCCTVYCTIRTEGRRHSWRILRGNGAEWVMFAATFSDVGVIPNANTYRFEHLI